MSNMFVYLVRETGGVLRLNADTAPIVSGNPSQGLLLDDSGLVYAELSGVPVTWANGLPISAAGRLCVATAPPAYYSSSIPFTNSGLVSVGADAPIDHYNQGLAYNANSSISADGLAPPFVPPESWGPLLRSSYSYYPQNDIVAFGSDDAGVWISLRSGGLAVRSNDGGATWTDLPTGLGIGGTDDWQNVATDKAGVWMAVGASGAGSRSLDNGLTWTAMVTGLGNPTPTTVIYDIDTNGTGVWIASSANGWATTSNDNGATWTAIVPQYLNMPVQSASQFAVHSMRQNGQWMIGCAVGYSTRSSDDGVTWTENQRGLNASTFSANIMSITSIGTTYLAGQANGFCGISNDEGVTWTQTVRGQNSGNLSADKWTITSNTNGVVLISGENGWASKSTNAGVTWAAQPRYFGANIDPSQQPPHTLAVEIDETDTALAGLQKAWWQRSTDQGANWDRGVMGFYADAINSYVLLCSALSIDGKVVIHGYVDGWMGRSTDGGNTYQPLPRGANCGNQNEDRSDIASNGNGVFVSVGSSYASRSTDDGATWEPLPRGLGGPTNIQDAFRRVRTDGLGVWVVGVYNSVRRSDDDGVTWNNISIGASGANTCIGLDTDGAGRWIYTDVNGNASTSTDNGLSWVNDLPDGLNCGSATEDLSLSCDRNGTWIAAGANGRCSRSLDNGITWTVLPRYLGATAAEGGFSDIRNDLKGNWLVVTSLGWAQVSDDLGVTWTLVSPQGLNSGITAVSLTKIGVAFNAPVWCTGGGLGYAAISPPL